MKAFAFIATIAAGIGAWFYRDRKRTGIQTDTRYRARVESTLDLVEGALAMRYRGKRLRVAAPRGTRRHGGYWQVFVRESGTWEAGFAYKGGHCAVVVDPENGHMPGGLSSVLAHELAHQVLWDNGIPTNGHHDLMRRAGILWAQV